MGNDLLVGNLAIFRRSNGIAAAFACVCGGQLAHGDLIFSHQSESIIVHSSIVCCQADKGASSKRVLPSDGPISLALTEFHFVLLYPTCIRAISRLNKKVVCCAVPPQNWPAGAPLCGFAHNVSKGAFWVWGSAGLLRVRVTREERHVWRLHLEAADFAAALSYCSPTELIQRDVVLAAQADHVFRERQFELAATQYAKTQQSVEEIALKFVTVSQGDALKVYLLHKLDLVDDSDTAQLAMLCIWLIDVYLHLLMSAADCAAATAVASEFREFLTDKRRNINRLTAYALIAAQGHVEESLHVATLCADWERVIMLHVEQRQCQEIFTLLSSMISGDSFADVISNRQLEAGRLIEKFSPQLSLLAPARLVEVWMRASSCLEPTKLLSAVMSYEMQLKHPHADNIGCHGISTHRGIQYLQHCVDAMGCETPVMWNCLVLLHAKHSQDQTLLTCLGGVRWAASDIPALRDKVCFEAGNFDANESDSLGVELLTEMGYDPQYALEMCHEFRRHEGSIMIYQSCRMHHDAVQLALQHGRIDLAKRSAEMVVAQPLRRVLWLKIIRYFVACCDDLCAVGDVLDLMEESRLQKEQPLLQLEDLLSVLPEFMLIDDVQRPVCTALTGYADRMEELRNEIDEAACAAAKLRDDVQRLERRQISALHRCCDCKEIMPLDVLSCCAQQLKCVQHVAFPCHHAFCIKCIGTSKAQAQSVEDSLSECFLCGIGMVDSVSKPFISSLAGNVQSRWQINPSQ